MSKPPNKYRDLHREIESIANIASGKNLLGVANSLLVLAARVKSMGEPVFEDGAWRYKELDSQRRWC